MEWPVGHGVSCMVFWVSAESFMNVLSSCLCRQDGAMRTDQEEIVSCSTWMGQCNPGQRPGA